MPERIVHHRHEEPPPNQPGIVACGISNVGIWSDDRLHKVTCKGCLRLPKEDKMFWKKKQPAPKISEVVARIMPTFEDLSKWTNIPLRGSFDLELEGPAHIRIRLYSTNTISYDLIIAGHDITLNQTDRLVINSFAKRWLTHEAAQRHAREKELTAARDDAIDFHLSTFNL